MKSIIIFTVTLVLMGCEITKKSKLDLSNFLLIGYKNDVPYFKDVSDNRIYFYNGNFNQLNSDTSFSPAFVNNKFVLFTKHDTVLKVKGNESTKKSIGIKPHDLIILNDSIYYTQKEFGPLKNINNHKEIVHSLFYEELWVRKKKLVFTDSINEPYKRILTYDMLSRQNEVIDSINIYNVSYISRDLSFWCIVDSNLNNVIYQSNCNDRRHIENQGFVTWFEYKESLYYISQDGKLQHFKELCS